LRSATAGAGGFTGSSDSMAKYGRADDKIMPHRAGVI